MSDDVSKKTLREIYVILKKHFIEFASIFESQNEKVLKVRRSGRKISKEITTSCCPTCSRPYEPKGKDTIETVRQKELTTAAVSNLDPSSSKQTEAHNAQISSGLSSCISSDDNLSDDTLEDSDDYSAFDQMYSSDPNYAQNSEKETLEEIKFANKYLQDENLSLMREFVDLKIETEVKDLRKDNSEDDDICRHLGTIDGILTKVLRSQTVAENLCDKLCEGLNMVNQNNEELPTELKSFCDRIRKTVGQDYREIGISLGLDVKTLNEIDNDFEEEDRLYHILLKLCTQKKMPSVHDVVTACHNVNPSILKFTGRPLSNAKARILERHYSYFYDEMHEIAVLPHLVSSGVMTLKQNQYVLKAQTKDQRIYRLITVICTREYGFDKLCEALDISQQQHVSEHLKDSLLSSEECMEDSEFMSDVKIVPLNLPNVETPTDTPLRRRNYSLNDLDVDDGKCSEVSFASSPAHLDPHVLLRKIAEMIQQVVPRY